jgi:hypothetical protein
MIPANRPRRSRANVVVPLERNQHAVSGASRAVIHALPEATCACAERSQAAAITSSMVARSAHVVSPSNIDDQHARSYPPRQAGHEHMLSSCSASDGASACRLRSSSGGRFVHR